MNKTQRILYVLNGTIGGATVSAVQLAQHLPDRYEGCFIYPDYSTRSLEQEYGITQKAAAIYLSSWKHYKTLTPVKRARNWVSKNVRSIFGFREVYQISRLCSEWNIDLIHTNSTTILSSAVAAKILRIPHVWHIRESIGKHTPFEFPPNDKIAAHIFQELSNCLVANSRQSAAFFEQYLGSEQVTVIPNGVPEPSDDIAVRGSKLRRELGIPADAVVIAKVASLGAPCKHHEFFLDAAIKVAQQRPDVWIVLFGHMPAGSYVDHIKGQALASGLGNRIVLAGHIQDVWSIMGSINILGHATTQESFGRIFVEAMLAGKPVVTPRGGGALDIVVDGETGFLARPDDVEDFSQRLMDLVQSPDLAHKFGTAGHKRAKAHFSMSAYVSALCGVYDHLLGNRPYQAELGNSDGTRKPATD